MRIVIDTDLGTIKVDDGEPLEYQPATYTLNIPGFVLNILFNKVERVGIQRFPPKKRKKRAPSANQQGMSKLEIEFGKITDLDLPLRGSQSQRSTASFQWWQPLKRYLEKCNGDIPLTIDKMNRIVTDMRKAGLTISSPLSIQNNFNSLVAKEKSGGGNQVIW